MNNNKMNGNDGFPSLPEEALRGAIRTRFDSPDPTPAQLARRERSLAVLKSLGVPYLAQLPVVEDESTQVPRPAREIVERLIAVVICAERGTNNDMELVHDLIERYRAEDYFSPEERSFIADPAPPMQAMIDYSWQFEIMHVLLWALGYLDALMPANEICDVNGNIDQIANRDFETLVAQARLRSAAALLDQADLYYHLHWSAIELRLRNESSKALDEGIIRERHRALNWLIRYQNQEWDQVTTDT